MKRLRKKRKRQERKVKEKDNIISSFYIMYICGKGDLIDNEYELDLCDNYEEIVSLTQENISNLQIQLKYS